MDYSRFLNNISQNRKFSIIRETAKLLVNDPPEVIFLGGGSPNPSMFPFETASIKLRDGRELNLDSEKMIKALQYGPTEGYPPLVSQLKALTKKFHSPPRWHDTELVVTPGSQDGLCKSIEMLINPNDYILISNPSYAGTIVQTNPYKPKYLEISCDESGMIPESLKAVLAPWKAEDIRNLKEGIPKVIYINPNAANPTGISFTTERRKEIYQIASDYNLLILEDDPFYFVQYDEIKNFSPSFLNLDVDGRVLRFDSFSKILSSGIRVGYVTGPKALIKHLTFHMQASFLHASSLSQVLVSEILDLWNEEGFLEHTVKLQKFYKGQCDAMLIAADKHLKDLCEWSVPAGGLFLWLKVPLIKDTEEMIMKRGIKNNVILVPGKGFMVDTEAPCQYLRASFSIATPEKMDLGLKYLAKLIREEIAIEEKIKVDKQS